MVSMIVPVYNAGFYLNPLIYSVLTQTWNNLEVILVDDGSTDGSADICDAAAKQDSRVRVIHKKNEGQSAARNAGLAIASGEYIAFADHDDLLHPRMYEYMMEAMQQYDTQVCACDFRNVNQQDMDAICFDMEQPSVSVVEQQEWLHDLFKPTWRTPIWNKLYHRSVLADIHFGAFRLGEDNMLSYQVLKKAGRTAFVHMPLYFQRMHGDNFEFTGIRYFTDLLRAKETILRDVKSCFPEEYSRFQKLFLYECVRIYNSYVDIANPQYAPQQEETMKLIKRNSCGIWLTDLPIGHKVLFTKLRIVKQDGLKDKIVI